MAEQLWSDERIEQEVRRIGDNMRLYIDDACTVAEQVRDDLQAALDAANETVAELQDALDGMRGIAQQRQKRVEELEAQLAKTWQPVEDGMTAILITALERYQRQIGRAEMQGWYSTNVAQTEMERIESTINELRGSDDEPPTLRLCRRVEKEQP